MISKNIKWLYYVSILTRVLCSSLNCPSVSSSPIATIPSDDICIKYGDPLEIFCCMNTTFMLNKNLSSDSLFFKRDGEKIDEGVSIVNSSTIRLYIDKPELQYSLYGCHTKVYDKFCINTVVVDTAPRKVETFECFAYYFKNVTCTWKPPKGYANTDYHIILKYPSSAANYEVIRNNDTYSTVVATKGTFFYRKIQRNFTFDLISNNTFGSLTQSFFVDHYARLVPSPPTNLILVSKTSHSAVLRWEISRDFITFLKEAIDHRVLYQTTQQGQWINANLTSLRKSKFGYEVNLTSLPYANMQYGVRVFYKSQYAPDESPFWSQFASIVITTLSEKPQCPPDTIAGSFDIVTIKPTRNIYIYWKQIEDYERNGDNFTYIVKEHNTGLEPSNVTLSYALFSDTSAKSLNISIQSFNTEGFSSKTSYVYVPAPKDLIKGPTYFTKLVFGNGTYELSWNVPESTRLVLKDFTLFWCYNDVEMIKECNGKMNFMTIEPHKRSYKVDLPTNKNMYQFAISANSKTSSSGMVWAKCSLSPTKDIAAVNSIKAKYTHSRNVTLEWGFECAYRESDIRGFIISYCKFDQGIECDDNPKNKTIHEPNATSVNISNLMPYSSYSFKILVISKDGVGVGGSSINVTTLEDAPSEPLNISIYDVRNSSLIVKWEPPLEANGAIYEYRVIYKTETEEKEASIKTRDMNSREYKIENLDGCTNYSISLQACTHNKCSNPSQPILIRTAIGPPTQIYQPNSSNINDKKYRISWLPPKIPGGYLDLYEVKFTLDNTIQRIENTTNLYYDIDSVCEGEKPIENVAIQVRAVNYDEDVNFGARVYTNFMNVHLLERKKLEMLQYTGNWSMSTWIHCTQKEDTNLPNLILCSFFLILLVLFMAFGSKRMWYRFKIMKDIGPVLPPGLNTEKETPKISNNIWGKKENEEKPFLSGSTSDKIQLLSSTDLVKGTQKNLSGSSENTDSTSVSLTSKGLVDNDSIDSPGSSNNSSLRLKASIDCEKAPISTVWDSPPGKRDNSYLQLVTQSLKPNIESLRGVEMDSISQNSFENAEFTCVPVKPSFETKFTLNPQTGYVTEIETVNIPKIIPTVTSLDSFSEIPSGYSRVKTAVESPEKVEEKPVLPKTVDKKQYTTLIPISVDQVKLNIPAATSRDYISHTDSILNKHLNILSGSGIEEEHVIIDPDMPPDVYSRFSWEKPNGSDNLDMVMAVPMRQ